jgi:hypothetical protein
MANTIKIKRRPSSGSAGKPSSLLNGELAFNEKDNILYYGYGSGVAGAATSIEEIGGSGYLATRGGTNASGLWPISVTGNAATVTDGVYTTGTQTINGLKTFGNSATFNSGVGLTAVNTSSNNVGFFAVFDNNPASSTQTLKSVSKSDVLDDIGGASSGIDMTAGSGLVGGGNLTASRTFNVGQGDGITVSADSIAVDSTVVRTTGTQSIGGIKTISDSLKIDVDGNILFEGVDDESNPVNLVLNGPQGIISSGMTVFMPSDSGVLAVDKRNMIAGSGLVGGGTISADRTFNIGQGDGITVSADSIAVNSTVVRTTGNQDIVGAKQFFESSNNNVIFSTSSDKINVKAPNTSDQTYYFVGLDGGGSPPSSTSADRSLVSRSASQVKSDLSLNNVENLALSGITFTAGSGLVGGGTLAANRTFDINTGDGIQIVSDAVAVDSTVVRTTGTQTISGVKTLSNRPVLNSGLSVLMASTASSGLYFPVFTSDPSSAAQALSHRTPSQVKGDVGLGNVTNDAQIKKLASTSGGFIPTWNGTNGDALNIGYSVETTLTGGTSAIPRADAVKTYVDNMVVSGIATNDAMIFKGAIDCSTNPNYPAADRGWVYKISVAGRIGGASGPVVEVNDTIICGTDGTAAGTHAAVGSNWNILQTNIVDASILVTGPASATSGNFAIFDGATGKIVRDAGFSSGVFATSSHVHGNITNAGAIGSTANLPIITTTAGALTTGSFGSTVNTFCQGNDSRLSDTRNTTNSITVNNGGAGDSSSFTFNGSAARTISYNSVGAPSTIGTNASGTWNISVTGNAGTVTSGIYTYGSYADPSWITSLAKSKVGLGNVENTALSTWAGSTNLTTLGTVATGTWSATLIAVNKGGTGQDTYTNGQLLIGNTTGNTLSKATLTEGTGIDITNGNGSITITHEDTSTLTGAQGGSGIAAFTLDGMGHVTAVTTATFLTAGTVCAAIVDCTLDGGSF